MRTVHRLARRCTLRDLCLSICTLYSATAVIYICSSTDPIKRDVSPRMLITEQWLTSHPGSRSSVPKRESAMLHKRRLYLAGMPSKTLSFKVCNGFANQRLALLNGMLLGKELGRAVVLPRFIVNGRQDDPSVTNYGGEAEADMTHFYNTTSFVEAMGRMGVQVVARPSNGSVAIVPEEATEAALGQQHPEDHLQFGCPLLQLSPQVILQNEGFVFGLLSALIPNSTLADLALRVISQLRGKHASNTYNALHLRIESDWMAHCSSWKFGLESDNCLTNTLDIDSHLRVKGVVPGVPLYVTLDRETAIAPVLVHVLKRLHEAGFRVFNRSDLLPSLSLPREVAALLDYTVALEASKFIGNSVSTFSALLILERERRGLWASYYNMGDIPLGEFMPMYMMPWVFMYSGGGTGAEDLDRIVKASVVSAIQARLTPFCVYGASIKSPLYQWLRHHGVHIILHVPAWQHEVRHALGRTYEPDGALTEMLTRIDIPNMPQLEQFNYILFTNADVVFERPLTLHSFPQPLPKSLALSFDMYDLLPCNGGEQCGALINLQYLRKFHAAFVQFLFFVPGFQNKHLASPM